MSYQARIKDLVFCMTELAGLDQVAALPSFEDGGLDTAQAALEECARFNEGVIAPLNYEGDRNSSSFKDGAVTTSPAFPERWKACELFDAHQPCGAEANMAKYLAAKAS